MSGDYVPGICGERVRMAVVHQLFGCDPTTSWIEGVRLGVNIDLDHWGVWAPVLWDGQAGVSFVRAANIEQVPAEGEGGGDE